MLPVWSHLINCNQNLPRPFSAHPVVLYPKEIPQSTIILYKIWKFAIYFLSQNINFFHDEIHNSFQSFGLTMYFPKFLYQRDSFQNTINDVDSCLHRWIYQAKVDHISRKYDTRILIDYQLPSIFPFFWLPSP